VFPRNENCCTDHRFAAVTVELLADDGTGNPCAVVDTFYGPDYVPGDPFASEVIEATVSAGSADVVGQLNAALTYIFEIDALTGTMDLIEIANPNPANVTTYLDLNDATAVIQLLNGVPTPGDYRMLGADIILGQFGQIVLPENAGVGFDTSELYETGILKVTPEPATLSLLGLGLLAVRRRRK